MTSGTKTVQREGTEAWWLCKQKQNSLIAGSVPMQPEMTAAINLCMAMDGLAHRGEHESREQRAESREQKAESIDTLVPACCFWDASMP